MSRTPVFIVCSPRPLVGKTLLSRLLIEYLQLQGRGAVGFDISVEEPALIDFLPDVTEPVEISTTQGKMALMDRLIVNDSVGKVVDLGFHAYDEFVGMIEQIGYLKEADRRGVDPVMMYVADADRTSGATFAKLKRAFANYAIIPVDNEFVLHGEPPASYAGLKTLRIRALPAFLKTYIDRPSFSFTRFLRQDTDSTSELNQWVRTSYLRFREIELNLIQYRM
jgi:hypothetical protein